MLRFVLLLLLAVPLAGCPAPVYSALVKPDAEVDGRGRFILPEADCRVTEGHGTCEPDEFQALVDASPSARVEGQLWSGHRVRGQSLLVADDTARFDGRPVPLADLERVWLLETPPAEVTGSLLAIPAVFGGLGALGGLADGGASPGEASAVAGGIGLALAVALRPRRWGERFEVAGWAPAPRPDNRLDVAGDGCQESRFSEPVSFREPDCLRPAVVVERSTATWVRQVDLVLRNGTRLKGHALSLGADRARLDGRPVAYVDLARIELRHPRPLAPLATAGKGAWEGALLGGAVGAGFALAEGEIGALWQGAAIGAGVLGAGGLVIGLLRPSDAARDVVVVPEP